MRNKQAFIVGLLLVMASPLMAQDSTNGGNVGFPINGIFQGSDFDTVQVNNGNLHLEIPIWSTDGRGLPVEMKMIYDNKGWFVKLQCQADGTCLGNVAGQIGNHLVLSVVNPFGYAFRGGHLGTKKLTVGECNVNINTTFIYGGYQVIEPTGATHHFLPEPAIIGGNTSCGPVGNMYADDNSGWMLKLDPTNGGLMGAYKPGGTFVGNISVEDTNGNQIADNGSPGTDTLGRAFNLDGSYKDSGGTLRSLQIVTVSVPIQTHLCQFNNGADSCTERTGPLTAPQSVTLPNGDKYTFQYEQSQYGEPNLITLPNGGQISYTWTAPIDQAGRMVSSRTVTTGGVSAAW